MKLIKTNTLISLAQYFISFNNALNYESGMEMYSYYTSSYQLDINSSKAFVLLWIRNKLLCFPQTLDKILLHKWYLGWHHQHGEWWYHQHGETLRACLESKVIQFFVQKPQARRRGCLISKKKYPPVPSSVIRYIFLLCHGFHTMKVNTYESDKPQNRRRESLITKKSSLFFDVITPPQTYRAEF